METKHLNLREFDEYKQMTLYTATGVAEGFVEPESPQQELAAWQWLHDTGNAYRLQGWFGRTAQQLIEAGAIDA